MFPFSFLLQWLFLTHLLAPGFAQAGSATAEELPRRGKHLGFFYIPLEPPYCLSHFLPILITQAPPAQGAYSEAASPAAPTHHPQSDVSTESAIKAHGGGEAGFRMSEGAAESGGHQPACHTSLGGVVLFPPQPRSSQVPWAVLRLPSWGRLCRKTRWVSLVPWCTALGGRGTSQAEATKGGFGLSIRNVF